MEGVMESKKDQMKVKERMKGGREGWRVRKEESKKGRQKQDVKKGGIDLRLSS